MTKQEAVERLVNSFSNIPTSWVAKVAQDSEDSFIEPMWGTMFMVNDSVDKRNILALQHTNQDKDSQFYGYQEIADIGLYVFMIDGEIVLGIDGAGYDFFESHWTPLYDLLGYNWHD